MGGAMQRGAAPDQMMPRTTTRIVVVALGPRRGDGPGRRTGLRLVGYGIRGMMERESRAVPSSGQERKEKEGKEKKKKKKRKKKKKKKIQRIPLLVQITTIAIAIAIALALALALALTLPPPSSPPADRASTRGHGPEPAPAPPPAPPPPAPAPPTNPGPRRPNERADERSAQDLLPWPSGIAPFIQMNLYISSPPHRVRSSTSNLAPLSLNLPLHPIFTRRHPPRRRPRRRPRHLVPSSASASARLIAPAVELTALHGTEIYSCDSLPHTHSLTHALTHALTQLAESPIASPVLASISAHEPSPIEIVPVPVPAPAPAPAPAPGPALIPPSLHSGYAPHPPPAFKGPSSPPSSSGVVADSVAKSRTVKATQILKRNTYQHHLPFLGHAPSSSHPPGILRQKLVAITVIHPPPSRDNPSFSPPGPTEYYCSLLSSRSPFLSSSTTKFLPATWAAAPMTRPASPSPHLRSLDKDPPMTSPPPHRHPVGGEILEKSTTPRKMSASQLGAIPPSGSHAHVPASRCRFRPPFHTSTSIPFPPTIFSPQ
ncbi:hypothetical protein MBM_04129 [Drepanopeziza brunnea f. sp. 'multigermtubi' MB_m1]|uniref:Uncharacterized protein n=1 Tax=Marssonina brunnea f. sp. multigermtubi (strain MB_m1) TaxID=1072389 RepID=K1WJD3_MARBU|nr:uncharacterized protein MBM_04129 [Drepanopeziza brunnea f. sp. 'multigermtubi' MB_m1]EKD17760.1 hypothetical protein MBM_04129 [Drepanopeziza brunnea f. sp. 'multigermtubi' MB_m1]